MLKLLTSPLAAIIGLASTLALTAMLVTARMEIRHLNKVEANLQDRLEIAQGNYATCKATRLALQTGLDQCNAGAENTARVANIVVGVGIEAVKTAQRGRTQVDVTLDALKAMPAATCDDALQILRQGAK